MRPRPDATRPRSRPRSERVRLRLRPKPNDLASRPHGPWYGNIELLHLFNGLFSRTTWVSRYQKGKNSLDFLNKARDDRVVGWQWHQLDHMQTICTFFRQITTQTPRHSIFTDRSSSWHPTNSVRALKHNCNIEVGTYQVGHVTVVVCMCVVVHAQHLSKTVLSRAVWCQQQRAHLSPAQRKTLVPIKFPCYYTSSLEQSACVPVTLTVVVIC